MVADESTGCCCKEHASWPLWSIPVMVSGVWRVEVVEPVKVVGCWPFIEISRKNFLLARRGDMVNKSYRNYQ